MSRRRNRGNGKEVIDKIIPLLIPGGPSDPNYRANYKRLRRHRDRIERHDPEMLTQIERDAERVLMDLGLIIGRRRVFKR